METQMRKRAAVARGYGCCGIADRVQVASGVTAARAAQASMIELRDVAFSTCRISSIPSHGARSSSSATTPET